MRQIVETLYDVAFAKITASLLELYPKEINRQGCKEVYFSKCGSRTTSLNITCSAW